jgi:hypothetical protein
MAAFVVKTLPHKHLLIYCLAAVVPLMLMGLLFNVPLVSNGSFVPGTDQRILGYIVQSEFLAAASGILPLIPLLFTIKRRSLRFVPKMTFAICGFGCAWLAYSAAGTTGMLFYALQVFVTFGGGTLFIFDWLYSVTRTFLTLLRWSVALFVYVTLQVQLGLDADIELWKDTTGAISFGATYFYILCLLEVLVYPPLTWHLEYRLRDELRYSVALDGFGRSLR